MCGVYPEDLEVVVSSVLEQPKPSTGKPEAVVWTSWPLGHGELAVWLLPVGLVGLYAVVALLTGSHALALMAVAAMILSLWRAFVPVEYQLDETGVTQRTMRRRRHLPWPVIGHCRPQEGGVLLVSHRRSPAIDAWTGVYLPWCEDRQRMIRILALHLPNARDAKKMLELH